MFYQDEMAATGKFRIVSFISIVFFSSLGYLTCCGKWMRIFKALKIIECFFFVFTFSPLAPPPHFFSIFFGVGLFLAKLSLSICKFTISVPHNATPTATACSSFRCYIFSTKKIVRANSFDRIPAKYLLINYAWDENSIEKRAA